MALRKMSKSLDNYIGIDEPADSMFGKLMSISDELMWKYLELLSFESMETIESWKKEVVDGENPRNIKFRLSSRNYYALSMIVIKPKKHSKTLSTDLQRIKFQMRWMSSLFLHGTKIANLLKDSNLVIVNIRSISND